MVTRRKSNCNRTMSRVTTGPLEVPQGSRTDPPSFELTDPSVTGPLEGARPRSLGGGPTPPRPPRPSASLRAAKGILRQRSFCGLCKMIKGSGGIIPSAAGGGPQPITEGGCATRPEPTCGAWGAGGFGAPQQPCTTRKVTTARLIFHSGAPLPRPLLTVTTLTDRRRAT